MGYIIGYDSEANNHNEITSKAVFSSHTTNFKREKDPLADRTTYPDYRPHSAHRPIIPKRVYKPSSGKVQSVRQIPRGNNYMI